MSEANTIISDAPAAAEAPAPTPAEAAPAAAAPPAEPRSQATVTEKPAPPAPAAEPASKDTDWRSAAISQVFGAPSDKDTPEVKAEREKLAKLAERYTTPGDALKALREAQVKISSGLKPMQAPGKDATPEQVKEYREAMGIPEAPDKYDLGLPEGTVLAEGDKALVDAWVEKVHGANAPPAIVKAGVSALMEIREAQAAKVTKDDLAHRSEVEEQLREAWGNQDYKRNIEGIRNMLTQADSEVAEAVMNARGPDGRALLNNPEVLKFFTKQARELGYVGATVTPQGGDLGMSVQQELDSLKELMAKDINAWHKNSKGQARYMELINVQQRLAGKGQKAA